MRLFAIAAIAGLSLAAATGLADARTWTDPAGRVMVDVPNGWSAIDQHNANYTYFIFGTANDECHVFAFPRPESASMSPDSVRRGALNDANYSTDAWVRVGTSITSVFTSAPTVVSTSKETDQFWPIQRAELQGERLVHAAGE